MIQLSAVRKKQVRAVAALGLSLSIADPAWPCMGIPLPGQCTKQLIQALQSQSNQTEKDLKALAKQIRRDGELHEPEAERMLTWGHRQTGLHFIRDPHAREWAENATPFAFAHRMEALRPKLTKGEWTSVAKAWATYLHETSEAIAGYDPKKYCVLPAEASSAAVDLGFTVVGVGAIVVVPFYMAKTLEETQDKKQATKDAAKLAAAPPALLGMGVATLTADVATFVPSVAADGISSLRYDLHLKQSAQAFSKFAKLATRLEQKYNTSPS